jgi:hypothetical protein
MRRVNMAKLHVMSGVLEGKVFDLLEELVTIGRALDNSIRLEDGTVSHHHAALIQDGADYKLRDLNSTNGTRVNGLRIVETKLHNGDHVRCGSVEMRYESDVKKASQPMPLSRAGVNTADLGRGGAPPATFAPVSPFARKRRIGLGALQWVLLGLGLVAAILLVWLLYGFLKAG